jgi:hypothetical protein
MKKHLISGAALLMLGALPASLAADASTRCSSFVDDAQRLACYDAQFGKPVRPDAAQKMSTPAPTATAPQAVVQVPPAAVLRSELLVPPAVPREQNVTGRITAVSRISNDRFVVTLDNGQMWTQLERDLSAEVQVGDTIKVRPTMLGSWTLETRGGVRTRVRSAR